MSLALGLSILTIAAFIGIVFWTRRVAEWRIRLITRIGVGIAVVAVLTYLVWPKPLMLYHPAQVSPTTLLFYQTAQLSSSFSSHVVLHVFRGTNASELWQKGLPDESAVSFFRNTLLVQDSSQCTITALRAQDSSELWRISYPNQNCLFTMEDSTIYLTSATYSNDNGHMTQAFIAAYSLDTHQPLWAQPFAMPEMFHLVTNPDVLYLLDGGVGLTALNPTNGQVRWQLPLTDAKEIRVGISLPDEIVISTSTSLRAYDSQSGQMRWSNNQVDSLQNLEASSGVIVGLTENNTKIGWEAVTGKDLWHYPITGQSLMGLQTIYFAPADPVSLSTSTIGAYNIQTGKVLWDVPKAGEVTTLLDTNLVTTDSQNALVLLNRGDGHTVQRIASPDKHTEWDVSMAQVAQTLFASTWVYQDGADCRFNCGLDPKLLAYDLNSGMLEWEIDTTWHSDYDILAIVGVLEEDNS